MKTKKLHFCLVLLIIPSLWSCNSKAAERTDNKSLRAPAYPLVTIDPYTNAWSFGDTLYNSSVKHWTGHDFPLIGILKVDGQPYRFMGVEDNDPTAIVPNAGLETWSGKYTTQKPAAGWENQDFDDSAWKNGEAAFGTKNFSTAKTVWNSKYIWVRRVVELDDNLQNKEIYLDYSHDDDAQIYVNGVKVVDTGNSCNNHLMVQLSDQVVSSLKPGKNVIAAYCHNPQGGGIIDFGLYAKDKRTNYFNQTAQQRSVKLSPTRTIYQFTCGPIQLDLTFTAPLLMNNLEFISRPVNYISYGINSIDGKKHQVELYIEASPLWAINIPGQSTVTETLSDNGFVFLKSGSLQQNILGTHGDNVRIDWGNFYIGTDSVKTFCSVGSNKDLRESFLNETFTTSICKGGNQRAAIVKKLGYVNNLKGHLMIGYDDNYSIQYFGENLRPYWNRTGKETILTQFYKANADYEALMTKCKEFDQNLIADATNAGGNKYAELCALAYRQAIAAHKLVKAPNGDLLFLSKENSSNGSIGTVDVTYPSAPMFLIYNTDLVKGMINPIFYYAESKKWTENYAAHDVGIYPIANGNKYNDKMPVEECGNMLILSAAIVKVEGNAEYAKKHWKTLSVWANYLLNNGLDPSNQLCTDDFAGHLAHNANLSIKAILGIASYGYLAGELGEKKLGKKYIQTAKLMANEWMTMAEDGNHYKLAFDKEGTWSQKYNLVWDKLFKWNIFPDKVAHKEVTYYIEKQNKYGLPLDNREAYTKTDWIMWTATLAPDKATFEKFIVPVYRFMNTTPDRIPMTDWMYTDRPEVKVFRARSVVGGYYIKMLEDKLNKHIIGNK